MITSFSATCSTIRPPFAWIALAPVTSTRIAIDERNLTAERYTTTPPFADSVRAANCGRSARSQRYRGDRTGRSAQALIHVFKSNGHGVPAVARKGKDRTALLPLQNSCSGGRITGTSDRMVPAFPSPVNRSARADWSVRCNNGPELTRGDPVAKHLELVAIERPVCVRRNGSGRSGRWRTTGI